MADTVLKAERDFEALREAVWVRFCARHRGTDREHFEDLYAEWWSREVERAARGVPSEAAAPAAFVAEAVHRVLIDDVRARARGVGREEKGALEIGDLADQRDAAGAGDTADDASYEALAHRVLSLVRDTLSERELRVFVWSFLYLQPSEQTARALGLSLPRVKKDRKRIAGKVGTQVWAVLEGELDLCAAYSEQSLPAVFELMTVHVEDCPTCRAALGGVRRGALAVLGPEFLVLGAAEPSTHIFSDLLARIYGIFNRSVETVTALPPQGRTAAAVAVAVTTVAGGAVTVVPDREPRPPQRAEREVARVDRQTPVATPAATAATASPTARPIATAAATARPQQGAQRAVARERRRERARAAATAAPTAASPSTPAEAVQEELTFEQQAPPAPAAPPPEPESAAAPASASAPKNPQEFGFEGP